MLQLTSAGECVQQKYRSAVYGLVNVLVSDSEKLNFKHKYSFLIFKAYETKFFTMISNVSK